MPTLDRQSVRIAVHIWVDVCLWWRRIYLGFVEGGLMSAKNAILTAIVAVVVVIGYDRYQKSHG